MSEHSALDRGRLLSIEVTVRRVAIAHAKEKTMTQAAVSRAFKKLHSIPNEQLGKLLKEYVEESQHNSWDGWESRDLVGAFALLSDFTDACIDGRLSETAKWEPSKEQSK